jgi:transposase-like protein
MSGTARQPQPIPCDEPQDHQNDAAAASGGPTTDAGKARSRRNACQHGLSADTLLAEVLGTERLERQKEQLRAQWQPASATEELLVVDMARHAAALELVEQAEAAVLRCGARSPLVALNPAAQDGPEAATERLLAAAVTTDALDRVTRYRRAHEKGFHNALLRLREVQTSARPAPAVATPRFIPQFNTEQECEAYLLARARRQPWTCPQCGPARRYWLAARQRWECAGCGQQFSFRAGTVLAGSPLPLTIWFAAIGALVADPHLATKVLAAAIGVGRLATVRQLAQRIRAALSSPQRTEELAGLDEFFERGPGT